jgi:hypothetical protein
MVLRMTTSYRLQTAQANEKPPWKSSLNLTLTQHLYDEHPKLRKVCFHLEVEPLRAWYYHISPNFHTLMILLKVTLLLVMNLKMSAKVFTKLKTLASLHGFQFPVLDIIIGYTV